MGPTSKFTESPRTYYCTLQTRGLVGLIGIASKYVFDALEKESILLCKNGLWCFESVKDGKVPINF